MTYPGGKGNVYQKIINIMPPHNVYIETHLGGGSVFLHKRPASLNFGIDIDPAVIAMWKKQIPGQTLVDILSDEVKTQNINIRQGDAVEFLKSYFPWCGKELIYCDPPYVMDTRRSGRLYDYEYTDGDHASLLSTVKALKCYVIVSGYFSEMYADALKDWNHFSFEAVTRGGSMATEHVWYNYEEPVELHDYRYLGDNFRERERIKRKKTRWINRLRKMPVLEKRALLSAIQESIV